MFLCRARDNFLMDFPSPNNNFLAKFHLFRPERKTVENIRFWARFWSQKSSKIVFSLFLRSKLQKAPKTRFGRKSAKFCKNGYFLAPEAFILRPSRKPFCRQCFFRCFEAHFHTFRTFPLIFSFFHQKAI